MRYIYREREKRKKNVEREREMQSLKTKHVCFAPLVICWSMMFVSSARDADQFLHTAAILHARGPGHGSRLWHQDILWGEAFERRFYCTGGKIIAVKTGNLWTNLHALLSEQGICEQTSYTFTRVCMLTYRHAHAHENTHTHTHTHTCTLLCCCDHHVLRRDYMWNICLDLGRTAPSLPCIYSLLFMPLPMRLFVCVCMHGYICV